MSEEVMKVKAAYQAWNDSKGANKQVWFDLVSDDFVMSSVAPGPGIQFTGTQTGLDRFRTYLTSLTDAWEMRFYHVDTIFGQDGEVAMFGTCSYTFKATGKTVTTPIANLWTFKNGKAVRCIEIFDSAQAVAAAS